MPKPSILLITSDQHRHDCLGFQGRPVRTPHLDRLAAEGTVFDAAICSNLVCQPARASILTGLLPLTHGVRDNGIDLPAATGEKGFAGTLAAAGYATGFIGKAHFATYHAIEATGSPECAESSAAFGLGWSGPYMGFEQVELMLVGHNYFLPERPPKGLHFEEWWWRHGPAGELNALYARRLPPACSGAQTFHSGLPPAFHNSTWTADRAIARLAAAAADPRPFCLWVSFPDPHHPFDCPEPWSRLHDPDAVDLPRHRTRDLERRPWWHRAALEGRPDGPPHVRRIREEYSRIPPQSDRQLREIIANYFGQISLIDHNVGRILAALGDLGLAEDTIVVFTSDHGEWLGDHGLVLKGPMAYESLLRVPLIARGPGIPAGRRVAAPVASIDLAATILDVSGAAAPAPIHGRSLAPLWQGTGTRDYAYSEWDLLPSRTGCALQLRTVRTARHKLTVDLLTGAGELYDLVEDPDEMDNLADDPGYSGVRRQLMEMIRARPDDALDQPLPQVGPA